MACICNIFFGGVVCMVIISVVVGCLIRMFDKVVILLWFWICSKEEMKKEKKEKQ